MEARGLDPAAYVISEDRVQFTSLPFFVRPGGGGFNYTVFINGESFSVTKANDMAFLGYFEQLCARRRLRRTNRSCSPQLRRGRA